MKTARDLLLLSAVAFQQNKFDEAGSLYAAALASSDANELLQALNKLGDPNATPLEQEAVASSGMSLSQIAASLSSAIGDMAEAEASEDDEDADDESESDDDEDDDEESESSEDESGDTGAPKTAQASAAPSKVQRKSKQGERKLVNSVSSPIKLVQ